MSESATFWSASPTAFTTALVAGATLIALLLRGRRSSAAKADGSKIVHPHGELRMLAPNIAQVTGSLPDIPLPRNMLVWRHQSTGEVVVHSAVLLDAQGMKALDAFTGGRVDLLIVPNSWHRADAAEFKRRYPSCKVLCPEEPRVRSAVEQHVRVDVGVALHSPCEELNKLDIKVHGPSGAFPGLVYELPVPDGVALVFCDVLFNVPKNHPMTRFQSFIAFYVTGSVGFFGVTRIGRLFGRLFGTLPKLKAWLQQQSERSDVTLIAVSHGTEVCGNAQCRDKLREAVARL